MEKVDLFHACTLVVWKDSLPAAIASMLRIAIEYVGWWVGNWRGMGPKQGTEWIAESPSDAFTKLTGQAQQQQPPTPPTPNPPPPPPKKPFGGRHAKRESAARRTKVSPTPLRAQRTNRTQKQVNRSSPPL